MSKDKKIVFSKNERPPGSSGHFLIGQFIEFVSDPLEFLMHTQQTYGDIAYINPPIGQAILLSKPNLIEELLVANGRKLIKFKVYDRVRPIIGNGLASSEGEVWVRQRRLAQPAFTKNV